MLFQAIVAALLLITGGVALGQTQSAQALTVDDVVAMLKAKLPEQVVLTRIEGYGKAFSLSTEELMRLNEAGASEKVMILMMDPNGGSADAATPDAPRSTGATSIPEELGAYFIQGAKLAPLTVEVVNFKTSGMLGALATMGVKKARYNGTVPGTKSNTQTPLPVGLVLRCADGANPAEYQLVMLEPSNGRRQFVAGRGGLTGVSLGVSDIAIPLQFERIARNVYKAAVTGLKMGEYGILPPDSIPTGPTNVSMGKMYTFGVR